MSFLISLFFLQMYLYLKKKNPKTFLVPCYDMDLIWHTHQVSFVIDQVNSLSPTIICCHNMKKYILALNRKKEEMHNVGRFEHIVFVLVFLYSYVILWIFFDFNATLMLLWQLGFYCSIFCRLFCSMTVKNTIISQNWNLWFFPCLERHLWRVVWRSFDREPSKAPPN